jgi:alkylhydroperoxidase family enzyme
LARRLGAREEWIAAVRREVPEEGAVIAGSLAGIAPSWEVALRFAEQVTESGHAVTEATYRDLAAHWDEGEVVELTLVAGLFSYFNRFNDALHVEVTR